MPKINEMFLMLKGFQYAESFYLNIGYYHLPLSKNASNLCMIVLPWGKYCCKRLTIGVANSPDMFQQKMNYFQGFKFIRACIDKFLILKRRLDRSFTEVGINAKQTERKGT